MLYFLVGEQLYLCQSRNNLALPAVDSGTAEFAAGSVVEQRFTTEVQRLEHIELHAVINCVGLLQKACSEQGDLAFLINAYCRTGWNGVTTVELARVVDAALDQVSIRRVDGLQMNKSLVNTRADFRLRGKGYSERISDMYNWIYGHKKLRMQRLFTAAKTEAPQGS